MEIETLLLGYGPLGIWTAYLLYEKTVLLKRQTLSFDNLNDTLRELIRKIK